MDKQFVSIQRSPISLIRQRGNGATFSGLPAGVTGNWAADVVTISGTPTAIGTFNYTVTLTGGCGNITATGSITVNQNPTTADAGADQNICGGTATLEEIHL
jgi:hypothetical protein